MFVRQIMVRQDQRAELHDSYVFSIPAIQSFTKLDLNKKVTFFVGENGSGKSTLLEAIAVACGFNAEGGSKNFRFSSRSTHSGLHEYLRVVKGIPYAKDGFFLRAESFYNVASYVDELGVDDSYGGKSLHEQSHGESFLALVKNRFWGSGLYILDEPEAALSPARQLALLVLLHDLAQENSQFIIATHSPILMAYPDADIFLLDEEGIQKTQYQQTEHYFITKRFLNDPQGMIRELFGENES